MSCGCSGKRRPTPDSHRNPGPPPTRVPAVIAPVIPARYPVRGSTYLGAPPQAPVQAAEIGATQAVPADDGAIYIPVTSYSGRRGNVVVFVLREPPR